MKSVCLLASLMFFATQVHATSSDLFGARGIPSCSIYALYLEHPTALAIELQHQLSMLDAVAEATGLPRGSFKPDFLNECRGQPDLTVDEVIKTLFDKYRGK